jgi:hypothetical protein
LNTIADRAVAAHGCGAAGERVQLGEIYVGVIGNRKKLLGVLGAEDRKVIWGTGGSDVQLACIFDLKISR